MPFFDGHPAVLTRILHPLDEGAFFRDCWARKPVVLASEARERFDGLFGVAELDEYLFVARPPAGEISVVRNGQFPPLKMVSSLIGGRYDLQSIYNAINEGYTVVLNAVHVRWPAARRLVIAVENRLLAHAQTNVYVTGPNAQGFARHADDHDVFVLQTHGTKRWVVYDKSVGVGGAGASEAKVLHDVELCCGDALYLPRGYPHEAATIGGLSVHVSMGVFPLTWQELAHQCIDTAALADPSWSVPVPLSSATDSTPLSDVTVEDRLRSALAPLSNLPALVESCRHSLTATERRKNPPPSSYLDSLCTLETLDVHSEVERRPGVGCYVETDSTSASIHFMGETVRGPLTTAPGLRFIASTCRFRIEQIDGGLSPTSKLVLVRRLIREGLLQRPTAEA